MNQEKENESKIQKGSKLHEFKEKIAPVNINSFQNQQPQSLSPFINYCRNELSPLPQKLETPLINNQYYLKKYDEQELDDQSHGKQEENLQNLFEIMLQEDNSPIENPKKYLVNLPGLYSHNKQYSMTIAQFKQQQYQYYQQQQLFYNKQQQMNQIEYLRSNVQQQDFKEGNYQFRALQQNTCEDQVQNLSSIQRNFELRNKDEQDSQIKKLMQETQKTNRKRSIKPKQKEEDLSKSTPTFNKNKVSVDMIESQDFSVQDLDQNIQKPRTETSKPPTTSCNCKKSKCLKLYCECFAIQQQCQETCNCLDCNNNDSFKKTRDKAIEVLLQKHSDPFGSKLQTLDQDVNKKGCTCKKSKCKKKYCECFGANLRCTITCRCENCKNGRKEHEQSLTNELRDLDHNIENFKQRRPSELSLKANELEIKAKRNHRESSQITMQRNKKNGIKAGINYEMTLNSTFDG